MWLAANFYIHFGWEIRSLAEKKRRKFSFKGLLGFFDYAEWPKGHGACRGEVRQKLPRFKPWNFLCATFSSYGNYDRRASACRFRRSRIGTRLQVEATSRLSRHKGQH